MKARCLPKPDSEYLHEIGPGEVFWEELLAPVVSFFGFVFWLLETL